MREPPLFALTTSETVLLCWGNIEGQEAPREPALEDSNKAQAVVHIMLMEINPIAFLCFLLFRHNADRGTHVCLKLNKSSNFVLKY